MKTLTCSTVLGLAASLLASVVSAQTPPPLTIEVTPTVAEPGVPRTLRVVGAWPDNCSLPTRIQVATSPVPSATNNLTLTSSPGLSFSPCPPPGTLSVSVSTTYTPATAGVQKITLTYGTQFILQSTLITRAVGGARAGTDLTGAWHDPAMPGSGLSLYHSLSGSDLAAGAFYLYDSNGKPHWLLLNNLRWNDESRFIADLFNVTGASTGGCLLLPACARPQAGSSQVGRVNGEVQADGKLRLAITVGPPFADPPFPYVLVLERLRF